MKRQTILVLVMTTIFAVHSASAEPTPTLLGSWSYGNNFGLYGPGLFEFGHLTSGGFGTTGTFPYEPLSLLLNSDEVGNTYYFTSQTSGSFDFESCVSWFTNGTVETVVMEMYKPSGGGGGGGTREDLAFGLDADFEGYIINAFALTVDGWTVIEHSPNDYIRWDCTIDIYGSVVPVPSAVLLGSIGLTFSGWLCRRRGGN